MRMIPQCLALLLVLGCPGEPTPGETDTDTDTDTDPPLVDADQDGFLSDVDCDDDDPTVYPGAPEFCNGKDNDCDGVVDSPDPQDGTTWYRDADGDGYGVDDDTVVACTQPAGYAAVGGDCDDDDEETYPGAVEECGDPVDRNCDGKTGDVDMDEDGFPACEDCDDDDPDVYPGAPETCNGKDNDCNGLVDDDPIDGILVYEDADRDGYGNPDVSRMACGTSPGWVTNGDDCDDTSAAVNPGAVERCNGIDDDCDGEIDGPDAIGGPAWYRDADGDGYGDPSDRLISCVEPDGYVDNDEDCDDTDPDVHPGVEHDGKDGPDGIDNNCNGYIDEDWYTYLHSKDIQSIWDSKCTSCHMGGAEVASLDLTDDAYDNIVGVPSTQASSLNRIEPGSLSKSYLWHKLKNTQSSVGGSGVSMPSGGSLDKGQLEMIETWIEEGAPP